MLSLSALGKEMRKNYVTQEFMKFLSSLDGVNELDAFEIIQGIDKKDVEAATNINTLFNELDRFFQK